jgi:hypothetical protein
MGAQQTGRLEKTAQPFQLGVFSLMTTGRQVETRAQRTANLFSLLLLKRLLTNIAKNI